jgi:endogenous inhibitor of DNA gyrase (YacG/DUF329 family)
MPSCPTCRKRVEPADNAYFPFCSERCKLVDLGRWIGEEYRIPAEDPPRSDVPPDDKSGIKTTVH